MAILNSEDRAATHIVCERLETIEPYRFLLSLAQKHMQLHEHLYVMGGAVRNSLLGSTIKDVDFFLSSSLLEKILGDSSLRCGKLELGQLGSPRWTHHESYEYIDLVPIEKVSHGFGVCRNIRETAKRMDITINSIAFNPFSKKLLDLCNGLSDIEKRLIRLVRFDFPDTPINGITSLTWRACLWFRVVHYAECLQMEIDSTTYKWLENNADCLKFMSEFSRAMFIPKLELANKIAQSGQNPHSPH